MLVGLCLPALFAHSSASALASPLPPVSSARPMRSAVSALMRSPSRIMRLAQPSPTRRGRFWVPPAHGSRPTAASGSATWACSSMMRRSQASAHSRPPPMA
ncbi:hypothetical protein G6F56_014313 [Rhizopus delemar]|nr:hypothetical protein G6F56_014313 [Rhizopus delemar]